MCEIRVTLFKFSNLIPKDDISDLLVEALCDLSVQNFAMVVIHMRAVYCKLVGGARQPKVPSDSLVMRLHR